MQFQGLRWIESRGLRGFHYSHCVHLKIALPAGFQIEYIKYNALNLQNMEILREGLRFKALLGGVPILETSGFC